MKTEIPTTPSSHYCVWFVSGTTPGQLRHRKQLLQLNQDMLVVRAPNNHAALEEAARLLRLRCGFPSFITRVFDRTDLLHMLDVLDRVDAGTLPAATDSDEDHLVWFENYLVPTDSSAEQRNLS